MAGTNTTAQQIKSVQNAGKLHEWPDEAGHPNEQTMAIYNKNQCCRAFEDWNDSDLFELARISKIQAMVVYETEKYEDEGAIIYGGKTGLTPIENPRGRAISTLNSSINSGLRRLGITASNSGGDRTARVNRAQQERDVEAVTRKPVDIPDDVPEHLRDSYVPDDKLMN